MFVQKTAEPLGASPELEAALAEVRQLIVDLRDAAKDGPGLAERYSAVLQNAVEEYCSEFEQRANSALARLDAAR